MSAPYTSCPTCCVRPPFERTMECAPTHGKTWVCQGGTQKLGERDDGRAAGPHKGAVHLLPAERAVGALCHSHHRRSRRSHAATGIYTVARLRSTARPAVSLRACRHPGRESGRLSGLLFHLQSDTPVRPRASAALRALVARQRV